MSISKLNYNDPVDGNKKIETVEFTRDAETINHQAYVFGWQPFLVGDALWFFNHGSAANQDIYPCHKLVVTAQNYWTASGSGTSEYYYNKYDFTSWLNTMEIIQVLANNNDMTQGDIGSLAAGEWGVGDNDTIGDNTIYVRLSDGTDPDTKADSYLTAAFAYPCLGASSGLILPAFTDSGQTAKVRPILYPGDLRREAGDTTRYNAPIILDEIDLSSVDIELGDSAFDSFGSAFNFDLMGATHFALALTTKPASGTIQFYGGVI